MIERNQYLSKLYPQKIIVFPNSLLALENVTKLILLPKRDQKNITFKSVTIFLH